MQRGRSGGRNFLSASETMQEDTSREELRRRFLALALEGYPREEITRGKPRAPFEEQPERETGHRSRRSTPTPQPRA